MMIVITLIVLLLLIALVKTAVLWRSAWGIEDGVTGAITVRPPPSAAGSGWNDRMQRSIERSRYPG
jgi:hypothetical protein